MTQKSRSIFTLVLMAATLSTSCFADAFRGTLKTARILQIAQKDKAVIQFNYRTACSDFLKDAPPLKENTGIVVGFGEGFFLRKPYVLVRVSDYRVVRAELDRIDAESIRVIGHAATHASKLSPELERALIFFKSMVGKQKNITFETKRSGSIIDRLLLVHLRSYVYVDDVRLRLDGSTYMIDLRREDFDNGTFRYSIRLDDVVLSSLEKYFDTQESSTVQVKGIIESRIEANTLRLKKIYQQSQAIIAQLRLGGADWQPISTDLVETISSAVADYGSETSFSVYTAQMQAAKEKIKTALRSSSEFAAIGADVNDGVARALVDGNRNLKTPMFGTEHMLYHLLVETGVNESKGLKILLRSLHDLGKQVDELGEGNVKLRAALDDGLSQMASIRDIEARFQQVLLELKTLCNIPNDLVDSFVQLALEYNAANHGAFSVLTAGHQVVIAKRDMLLKEHPFFKDSSERDLRTLQVGWQPSTSSSGAIVTLSEFVRSQEVVAKRDELLRLQKTIQYLRQD